MKRNIVIEKAQGIPLEKREVEIVERKGIGHPDTICDFCSEFVSQALSQYYLKKFGQVLHHNLDKGLLIAGRSQPKFGGGKVIEPIKIIIAGRATDKVGKNKIPVEKIGKEIVEKKLKEVLNLPPKTQKNFKISISYKSGAENLKEVFKRSQKIPLANDTSFGVAHGPFSRAERVTLLVANLLNSKKFIAQFPFVGRDVKVMTLRKKENLFVTFSVSYIDRYVKGMKDYFEKKEKIKKIVENFVKRKFNFKKIKVFHNTLDNPQAKDEKEIYLTVLGLSAEQGDDGQVGRGNRVSGLITPCREMSLEAAAGKNINHPGKLYQILSFIIAQKIGKITGVRECSVRILSQIGRPLDEPQVVSVKIFAENFTLIKNKAYRIVENILNNLRKIQSEIVKGKHPVC
jgi:S-adenosylmethionine synthetase